MANNPNDASLGVTVEATNATKDAFAEAASEAQSAADKIAKASEGVEDAAEKAQVTWKEFLESLKTTGNAANEAEKPVEKLILDFGDLNQAIKSAAWSEFREGLKETENETERFHEKWQELKGEFMGGLAGGFAAGGLMQLAEVPERLFDKFKELRDVILEVAHSEYDAGIQAQRLGGSVEDVTALQSAFEAVGGSAQAMDQIIFKLTSRGLSVEDYARKLMSIEDPVQRAAKAHAALGRQAAIALPWLETVAREGLDGLREKAIESGAAISATSVAIGKELVDAQREAHHATESLVRQFSDNMEPILTTVYKGMTELVQATKEYGDYIPIIGPLLSKQSDILAEIADKKKAIADADVKAKSAAEKAAKEERKHQEEIAEGYKILQDQKDWEEKTAKAEEARVAKERMDDEHNFAFMLKLKTDAVKEEARVKEYWRLQGNEADRKLDKMKIDLERSNKDFAIAEAKDKAEKQLEIAKQEYAREEHLARETGKIIADSLMRPVEDAFRGKNVGDAFKDMLKKLGEEALKSELKNVLQNLVMEALTGGQGPPGAGAAGAAGGIGALLTGGKGAGAGSGGGPIGTLLQLLGVGTTAAGLAGGAGGAGTTPVAPDHEQISGGVNFGEVGAGTFVPRAQSAGAGLLGALPVIGQIAQLAMLAHQGGFVGPYGLEHFAGGGVAGIVHAGAGWPVDDVSVKVARGEGIITPSTTQALRRELAVSGGTHFASGGVADSGGGAIHLHFSSQSPMTGIEGERFIEHTVKPAIMAVARDGLMDTLRDHFARS